MNKFHISASFLMELLLLLYISFAFVFHTLFINSVWRFIQNICMAVLNSYTYILYLSQSYVYRAPKYKLQRSLLKRHKKFTDIQIYFYIIFTVLIISYVPSTSLFYFQVVWKKLLKTDIRPPGHCVPFFIIIS